MKANNVLNYPSIIAVILNFFTAAGGLLSSIYSNTLFLSSYPAKWLAYFLISQAVVNTLGSFILTPLLANNIKHNSIILLNISAALIVAIFFIIKLHYFWLPFVIAVSIGLISSILIVIGWNIITLAFSMREYKRVIIYINQASIIGVVIGGLLSSLLLHYFPLHSLLLLLVISLLGSSVMTYYLPLIAEQQTIGKKQHKHKATSPFRFPLYRNVLYFSIIMITIQAFIEYIFKLHIAEHYSNQDIGIFMGYFVSITNILGLLVTFTMNKQFLDFFRLDGLLYATPIFTFLSCMVVFWIPEFWSICVLASTKSLFYYNHTRIGMEISLNILPAASRLKGKSQFKYIINPFANVASFLFLLAITKFMNTRAILIMTGALCFICIYFVRKITQAYKKTLQEETEFKRFNFKERTNQVTEKFFKDAILSQFKQTQDPDLILYYLNMLKKFKTVTPSLSLYQQLSSSKPQIRRAAIKLISRNKTIDSLNYFIRQFNAETEEEIRCILFDAIRFLNFDEALKIAKKYKHDVNNLIYPDILGVFLYSNQHNERSYALDELRKLVNHHNVFIRKETAYLIGQYAIVELGKELGLLIADQDITVCKTAIKAAAHAQIISLLPLIIQCLPKKQCIRTIKLALVELGANIIPIISQHMNDSNEHKTLLIRIIARIPGLNSEHQLFKMLKEESIYWQTLIAKEVNYRACYQTVSDELKIYARQLALEGCYAVSYLEKLTHLYLNPFIVTEIAARIQLAKRRILFWIGVAFDPILMNKLIPSLLTSKSSLIYQNAKLGALELLEIIISDSKLKQQIIDLFEEGDRNKDFLDESYIYKDDCLDQVIKLALLPQEKENMNLLLKAFNLRASDLFKDLPIEILMSIAEETEEKFFNEGEIIFEENDFPDGLYCITSGKVKIIRQEKLLNVLSTNDFFGELALIDDSIRSASAVADSDCILLFLEKSTFDRITDDLPEVLRGATKSLLNYLRHHMQATV